MRQSQGEPARTGIRGQKFHPHPSVPTQRHFVCSRTPVPSDVLSAKLMHECPYLVVGDPPSTGDDTGIPGSTVTQGHRACLRQGSRRDRFTYKVTPNTSANAIHAQQMKLSNFHTCPNPACELSRGPGQRQYGLAKLEGSTDRAEAVSAAALHSSPTEAEASCATAPSSAQLHEGAVTLLLTTRGQLPPPPRNGAQAGFAQLVSHEIHATALTLPA